MLEISTKHRYVPSSLRKILEYEMVYIGSEAKWRLYYEGGVKKILALAGAEGRHKNMFSAVISTATTRLLRVKENKAKENELIRLIPNRRRHAPSSLPRDYCVFSTDIISAAAYSGTVMCVGSCAYPLHL